MKHHVPGWLTADGKFICIQCDTKTHHKTAWVLRSAEECIHRENHNRKIAMPKRRDGNHKKTG